MNRQDEAQAKREAAIRLRRLAAIYEPPGWPGQPAFMMSAIILEQDAQYLEASLIQSRPAVGTKEPN